MRTNRKTRGKDMREYTGGRVDNEREAFHFITIQAFNN